MAIRLTRRSSVLPVDSGRLKNFESIARGFLLILSSASFLRSIPWSTMSKAFLKSKKRAWAPMRPSGELSVALNHFWEIQARADTVDRFCIKACWLFLTSRSCLCKDNWSFSSTFASCGRTDIWRKSLSISFGGFTFGTGQINACLYGFGYLHWMILAHMMLCTTRASSSL